MEQGACEITYWKHSGFSVRTGGRLLIFDYIGGGMTPPIAQERALVFVSHAHADHFDPRVCDWTARRFAGDDLPEAFPGMRMKPGDEFLEPGLCVRAFPSTDQGVSFYVETDEVRIFHAGDLNFWHWRAESSDAEVQAADAAFQAALDALTGLRIDVAFFPVDARLRVDFDEGARRFAQALRPAVLVPMHWWNDAHVALDFARSPMPSGVQVLALTVPGEHAVIPARNATTI